MQLKPFRNLFAVCCFLTMARTVFGFGTGAPYKTCIDAYPKHDHGHVLPQTTDAPYTISLDKNSYSPGETIRVTLGSPGNTVPFRGFQVRAHKTTGDQEDIIGNFVDVPDDTRLQFWYPEVDGEYNCATHKNGSDKLEVILLWKAPAISVGDILFRSGFVKDFKTFWPDVRSITVVAKTPAQIVETDESVTSVLSPLDLGQCGVSKGCLLYPSACSGTECRFGLTYSLTQDEKYIIFDIFGETNTQEYLSVGFSHDKFMGDDSVISCYMNGDLSSIGFIHGYCPAKYCDRIPIDNVTDLAIRREEGRFTCEFKRPVEMLNHAYKQNYKTGELVKVYPVNFDLRNPFYVFIAWGKLAGGKEVIGKHQQLPLVSHHKINLTSINLEFSQQLPLMLQIHAALGIISWLGLVGFGMVTARHYREDFKRPCLGIGAWFQIHRAGMILSICVSAVAIIIIFVHLRGWTEHATIHGIFGLVAVGLSLIQTGIGFCRPASTSSARPVFNWFHRIIAVVALITAAICMLLGAQNELLHPTLRQIETIIISVGMFFQVFWEVILEFQNLKKVLSKKDDQSKKEPGITGGLEVEEDPPNSGFNTKVFVYGCFVTTTVVTVLLCIIFIFELV